MFVPNNFIQVIKMFWQESFRIGVDHIDEQHITLFAKTQELMDEVCRIGPDKKQKCISMILFLKDYAVKHFTDEEAYMESVGCPELAEHRQLHCQFVKTVLQHEKKMTESDFDDADINDFTGVLISWLLYHIADSDQRIVSSV